MKQGNFVPKSDKLLLFSARILWYGVRATNNSLQIRSGPIVFHLFQWQG